MASLPPNRFPAPGGTPYQFVGPNYNKYGEVTGRIYDPNTDKYYIDPRAKIELDKARGLGPKESSLSDLIVPIAAVGGTAALANQFGSSIIPTIKESIPSFKGLLGLGGETGGGAGAAGLASSTELAPAIGSSYFGPGGAYGVGEMGGMASPNWAAFTEAGATSPGLGASTGSLSPISGAPGAGTGTFGMAPGMLPGLGLVASAPLWAPSLISGGEKFAEFTGLTDKNPKRNFNTELAKGLLFEESKSPFFDINRQIDGFYGLPQEQQAAVLQKAHDIGALPLTGHGGEGGRVGEVIDYKKFFNVDPDTGRFVKPENYDYRDRDGSKMTFYKPQATPTLEDVSKMGWLSPEKRQSLTDLVSTINTVQNPFVNNPLPTPGVTTPPRTIQGMLGALPPPTPAPVSTRSNSLSPGIGLDGRRINY